MTVSDNLLRNVYCFLGIPLDAIGLAETLQRLDDAVNKREPFFISTPNLSFLVTSRTDRQFRESLLASDVCIADGMPIVWMARMLRMPIPARVPGSDLFAALKTRTPTVRRLKVFLFGGPEGIAERACRALNSRSSGLICTGCIYPGFSTVAAMSAPELIEQINDSGADLLVVALGARKGQLWLQHNHRRLTVPVRAHLGAVLNFEAGTISRAPHIIQKAGFEWAWRIKEEPRLWLRYRHDSLQLLLLLLTRVGPLAVRMGFSSLLGTARRGDLVIGRSCREGSTLLKLSGFATARNIEKAIVHFRDALTEGQPITLDCSQTRAFDPRFLGLILMLRKCLREREMELELVGVSPPLKKTLQLHGAEYLIEPTRNANRDASFVENQF